MLSKCINDYFEIIEKHGTEELKAVKYELLFECGRSFAFRTTKMFMESCTACGGDWGAMLYSGLRELYPHVYRIIPETPTTDGTVNFAFVATVIRLCGVTD